MQIEGFRIRVLAKFGPRALYRDLDPGRILTDPDQGWFFESRITIERLTPKAPIRYSFTIILRDLRSFEVQSYGSGFFLLAKTGSAFSIPFKYIWREIKSIYTLLDIKIKTIKKK